MNTKNIITSLTDSLLDEVKKVMKNEKEKGESKADEKAEHCSEALKGDQHKIDANKNGKVDAHDFKLLRKKKGVAETYATMKAGEEISEKSEQIDELSKKTLASYAHKAIAKTTHSAGEHEYGKHSGADDDDDDMEHHSNTMRKRDAGIKTAVKKLTGKKLKTADSIHKDVEKSKYHSGEAGAMTGSGYRDYGDDEDRETRSHEKKAENAKSSAQAKIAKLAKEEVEDLDEDLGAQISELIRKKNAATSPIARKNIDSEIAKLKRQKTKVTEEAEQIDELSKSTLASYVKKAAGSAANKGMEHGVKKAEAEEMDRVMNRHMSFGDKDKVRGIMKTTTKEVEKPREKAMRRLQGIDRAVNKITKEEVELTQEEIDRLDAMMADLEEGRGRPPKEGSEAWKKRQEEGAAEQDEPRQHPIQQLERIKRDMRGGADFKHRDGSTHHVTGVQASKILAKYHGLKPAEKETMQKEIHGSHAGLKKHL